MPSACLRLHVVPLPYSVGTFGLLPYKKWLPLFGLSRGSRKAGFFERVLRAGVGALTPSWCKDLLLGVPARVTISPFSVYSSQRGSPVASGPLRLRGSGARTTSLPRSSGPGTVVPLRVRLHHVFLYDVACCPPLLVGQLRERQGATVRAGLLRWRSGASEAKCCAPLRQASTPESRGPLPSAPRRSGG